MAISKITTSSINKPFGFKNLIIGLENFSYSVLFVSLFFNTLLFLLIAMLRYYFPSMSIKYD